MAPVKSCVGWFLHVFGKMLQKLFFFSTLRWHKLDFFELIVAILLFLLGRHAKMAKQGPPTYSYAIIKESDIRLICHLAGRSEDAIYS